MAAPVRKVVVNFDKSYAPILEANAGSVLFTQRLYFSNFRAAAVTANYDLTGFPGGLVIEGAFALLNTNFSGGAAATATFSAGTTGSVAAYIAATDVFTTAGATVTVPVALVGVTLVPGTFVGATPLVAGTVRTQIVTTVGNTNVLTQGCIDIYLRLRAVAYRAR